MTDIRRRAIELYDAFTHEHCDRRRLLRDMTALAGSAVAAEALIASIAASPAAAQQVPEDDPRLVTDFYEPGAFPDSLRKLRGLRTMLKEGYPKAAVMVIHENRGLTPHIRDVSRRLALEGFLVFTPDFLADAGGTPADEDRAREMIGQLDLGRAVESAVFALVRLRYDVSPITVQPIESLRKGKMLKGKAPVRPTGPDFIGKVGVVGFCWGGAMVNRIAVTAGERLDAAVAYYGPAPDPSEAAKVQAAMLLHYAGNDTRVNATGEPWTAALKAAGKTVEAYTYPGVDHAFNNDTSAQRYNAEAAKLAWERTLAFLHARLAA